MVFVLRPATGGDPVVLRAGEEGVEMSEKSVFEVQGARHLEDARDGGGFAKRGAGNHGGGEMVGVDEVGAHVLHEVLASLKHGWDLPRMARGDVEGERDYGGARFPVSGGEAGGGGGEDDYDFEA